VGLVLFAGEVHQVEDVLAEDLAGGFVDAAELELVGGWALFEELLQFGLFNSEGL
jgi:hypothetical protein